MSADTTAARTIMVDSQVRTQDVTSLAIQDAMRAILREALLAPDKAWAAYADMEVEYAPGRWLLRPRDVAKLLQGLSPAGGEQALALSAPYAAAVLEYMGLTVTQADAADPVAGVYDLIICEGAVAKAPAAWTAALAPGGRLGVVERDGPIGRAMLFLRSGGTVGSLPLFDCTPPFMAGFAPQRGFVF
jgi:protein-L-isoaspartate(D-aspartate) O-methyltransferase